MTMRWLAWLIAVGLITGAGLAACGQAGGTGSGPGNGYRLAHGSPLASVPGADKAAALAIVKQCTPATASGVQQLRWATDMLNDTQAHPNGSRTRLWNCVGIPQDRREAAKGALITDIEHVKWNHAASRKLFWDATLPGWVQQWRSG